MRGWAKLKAQVESIVAITTKDYPTPAARPRNSRLDNSKLKQVFNIELPHWQQGLKQVMQTIVL